MRDSLERKMRRGAMVVAAFLTMLPSIAHAQGARTQFLADKLKSDDFRVRTNAALALGATNDPAAVEPLCRALDDPKEVVRQAAAVAHKRLGRSSSLPCLKVHKSSERNEGVRVQITRAVESIEAAGGAVLETDTQRVSSDRKQRDAMIRERGLTGVPGFLIGRKYVLAGAQPPEVWTRLIDDLVASA